MNKKALYFINMAYLCADVANTFAMEAEEILKHENLEFSFEKKRNFNEMMKAAERIKFTSERVATCLYEAEHATSGCILSDFLFNKIQELLPATDEQATHGETKISININKQP